MKKYCLMFGNMEIIEYVVVLILGGSFIEPH